MNISFNDSTYQALCLLATEKGQSVAAYISDHMDDHARDHVNIQYSLKKDSGSFMLLPSDSNRTQI